MSGVRDPAFWKRFSVAVHMDEETGHSRAEQLKNGEGWLARQQAKRYRRTVCCYAFWTLFLLLVAAVIIIVVLVVNNVRFGSASSSNQMADPNSSVSGAKN